MTIYESVDKARQDLDKSIEECNSKITEYRWLKELEFHREWWSKYEEAFLNSEFSRMHGYWKSRINKDYEEWLECSCCGFETGRLNYFNYCPECGAYMKGADNE